VSIARILNQSRVMMAYAITLCAISLLLPAAVVSAQTLAPFNRQAWLEDLGEVRTALSTKYAGLEWEVFERDVDLNQIFATAEGRIAHAGSDWEAHRAFETLMDRFGDKHVLIRWRPTDPHPERSMGGLSCDGMGYTTGMQAEPLLAFLPGFTPIPLPPENVFPTGMVVRGSRRVGIIKIPLFMALGFPSLCELALDELHIDRTGQCDDNCQGRVWARAENILTLQFEAAIDAVKAAGASVLIVDLAGNTGGSEWEGGCGFANGDADQA
jgi:hypothetical protein